MKMLIQLSFCIRCEREFQCWTGIILTRMPAILRLQNSSRRLHILIASYLTQRREGNMTLQDSRCFSSHSSYSVSSYVKFCGVYACVCMKIIAGRSKINYNKFKKHFKFGLCLNESLYYPNHSLFLFLLYF